eukprot:GHVT01041582.1.p1 GENE.GHVT01041582.1~~GHVT01041582.1.p1  ORF type:complete len:361 (+),score=56.75 GHVT01041582.1:304-1386(+)
MRRVGRVRPPAWPAVRRLQRDFCREIEREPERLVGRTKMISRQPILLRVFSPFVVIDRITLVDLPGVTKVPVGEQPADIEHQVRLLLLEYLERPHCIILAVTAANTDLANSDSLKIAREVDPEGTRTVGVITKCDTLEEGSDAMQMLMGKVYPLKRGYVGVVCRSQRQTEQRKSIRDALAEEEKLFQSHPAYRGVASRGGTAYLAHTLNQILMHHIRDSLPQFLKTRIARMLQESELELARLHRREAAERPPAGPTDGGARVHFIFHDWYANPLSEFDPLQGVTDHEIQTAIRNATGPRAALFVPEGAFDILVKRQIRHLESPSLQCVEQVPPNSRIRRNRYFAVATYCYYFSYCYYCCR